ncbi:membrane protein [Actinoallomurus oryzae]|uniref:Membrane protein n=1 Tax=Actinoallomurus oryzae TaxID=502180 RepID=A0ABP8R5D1_9ACTN
MLETFLHIALIAAVLLLIGVYVSWRATRLDRLHVRLETARAGLDAALVRRAAVALELAASRQLDPATSLLLAAAAHEARIADADNREFAESDLSRALRAVVGQPDFRPTLAAREDGAALLDDLDAAVRKVTYARSFYNNAVTATRTARRKLLPRVLPLHGRAPLPDFFEIDDAPPES